MAKSQLKLIRAMPRSSLFKPAKSSLLASRAEIPRRPFPHRQCQRLYSIQSDEAAIARLPGINPEALSISRTTTPKELLPAEELVFGRNFTGMLRSRCVADGSLTCELSDHMLSVEWTASDGWLAPRITPYQNLSLDPATCVFHYAFECFEGMKAYKNQKGQIHLFRPDKNMARMNSSASRIALPNFEPNSFLKLISKFVSLEQRFIPT